jgi:F0F1-type ATP synthase assembly protein I
VAPDPAHDDPRTDDGYEPTDWRESFREAAPYLGLGMQIAVSMALFVGGGYLLDQWLGTLPWMTVLGAVIGLVGVIALIVRVSQDMGGASGTSSRPNDDA